MRIATADFAFYCMFHHLPPYIASGSLTATQGTRLRPLLLPRPAFLPKPQCQEPLLSAVCMHQKLW